MLWLFFYPIKYGTVLANSWRSWRIIKNGELHWQFKPQKEIFLDSLKQDYQ